MKTYEVITHEILTKTFRHKANSEEEAWEAHLYSCTDCLVDESTSHVLAEGVRLINSKWHAWHEEKEVNEVGEE